MGNEPCIPGRQNRNEVVPYNTDLYRKRHVVETKLATLKDWRAVFVRYERAAWAFMATVVLEARVSFRCQD